MRVCIFVVAAAAVALPMLPTIQGQTTERVMPPKNCWPNNDTVWECFASLPEERLLQRPCPVNDSYLTEKGKGLDFADYSVMTVQKAPKRFCDHKDRLFDALQCMTSFMTSRCPDMPQEMKPGSERLKQAFDRFCGKVDETNTTCMQHHWMASRMCKKHVMEEMRKFRGMQPPESGDWESGSGGIKDGATPLPNKESLPESGALTGKADPEPESESEPTWEPEPELGMDGDREENMICNFKYRMMRCVKQKMKACHGRTAEVIANFMKEMATAPCAAMMDTWAAQVTGDNCMGPDCSGASKLPVDGMICLLALILVIWIFG